MASGRPHLVISTTERLVIPRSPNIPCDGPSTSSLWWRQSLDLEEITGKLADFSPPDRNLPDNPIVLSEQLREVNSDIAQLRRTIAGLLPPFYDITKSEKELTDLATELQKLDCKRPDQFTPLLQRLLRVLIRQEVQAINLGAISPDIYFVNSLQGIPPEAVCSRLKSNLNQEAMKEIHAAFERVQKQTSEAAKNAASIKDQGTRLLEALQK